MQRRRTRTGALGVFARFAGLHIASAVRAPAVGESKSLPELGVVLFRREDVARGRLALQDALGAGACACACGRARVHPLRLLVVHHLDPAGAFGREHRKCLLRALLLRGLRAGVGDGAAVR